MDLYILRHAIAVEREAARVRRDFDRALTMEGKKKLRAVAKGIRKLDLSFDLILTSPFIRAKETADITAQILGVENLVQVSEALGADRNPRAFLSEFCQQKSPPESIMLVGHEPFLSSLVSLLISGRLGSCITLKKAGFCKLTLGRLRVGRCGTLDWLLTPRQLMLLE